MLDNEKPTLDSGQMIFRNVKPTLDNGQWKTDNIQ